MANDVFANGREVSCKKADGKSICAFPDVCMTPPENPATPPGVPVPYPNTGMAKDMTSGSKKVKVSGKEVVLKNKSFFKKSMGDEAGCAAKKGVVTSVNRGKVYFISWSMDVKAEGKNIVRHLDMTTHNHSSPTTNTPPWPYIDSAALESGESECSDIAEKVKEACPPPEKSLAIKKRGDSVPTDFSGGKIIKDPPPGPQDNTSPECCEARKCMLVPKEPSARCEECNNKTGHHPVPVADFSYTRKETAKIKGVDNVERGDPLPEFKNYDHEKAPCICVDGPVHSSRERIGDVLSLMQHGRIANNYNQNRDKRLKELGRENFSYDEVNEIAAQAVADETGCKKECIQEQLDSGHKAMGVDPTVKKMRRGDKATHLLEKPAPVTPSC